MRKEATLLIAFVFALAAPFTASAEVACRIPKPGNFTHSCQALTADLDHIKRSQHALDRWASCELEKKGLPCGCTADIIFFSDLVPIWEKELSLYLKSLGSREGFDRKKLESEQKIWLLQRQKKEEELHRDNDQEGSYWGIQITFGRLELLRNRSLELGCELEKSVQRTSQKR
jgi:hypothetical protein